MSHPLCLCQRCKRHVHANASRCPFCAHDLAGPGVSTTLGFTLAAGVFALSMQGCDPSKADPDPPAVAVYGPPPIAQQDAAAAPTVSNGPDTGPPAPAYGPPPVDAAVAPPANTQDASHPAVPAYGPPPMPPGKSAVPPTTPPAKRQ